jgi:hypothetical protein
MSDPLEVPAVSPTDPPLEDVSESFGRLAASAKTLNTVSDELAKPVGRIDAILKMLNLGIEAWVQTVGGWETVDEVEEHFVGYAKVEGDWGLAVRIKRGRPGDDYRVSSDEWRFNSAPRSLRVEAIDALPELLDRLSKKSDSMIKKLKEKTERAERLASLLERPSKQNQTSRREEKSTKA